MAFIQKTSPPPNRILTFSMKNFVGGLNNRSNILEANQAFDSPNMKFTNDTVMDKRDGTGYFDTLALTSSITYIGETKPYVDPDVLLRASNTGLYGGSTLLKTISGQMRGVNFNGKFYFVDGKSLHVYGKYPQTTSTHVKIVGTATNTYEVMEIVTPGTYTPLDTTFAQGVYVYDYTNKKVWYEPCENELKDTAKQGNVVPRNPKYIVVHNGRLFVSGDKNDNDNVFISDVQNTFYFPASLPMQPPPSSDEVKGLIVYDDSVVVAREHDMYVITGMTNDRSLGFELFRLRRINTHTGIANCDSMKHVHNYLFFLGSDGVMYALSSSRQEERVLSTQVISNTLDLFTAPFSFTKADLRESSSIFFDDEWYLAIKDKVLVYNYKNRAWTYYKWKDINIRSFYTYNGKLLMGTNTGRTVEFIQDGLDLGVPFRARWTSKVYDMDDANSYKQFREFFIVAHTFDNYKSDVRMTFEVDYVDVATEIVIQNQIARWGTSVFGDRFITRNINASLPFMVGRRARGIRFSITNGFYPSNPVATKTELETYPNKKEGTLVLVQDENNYYLFTGGIWELQGADDLNQKMRVYQVNGEYEFRGKR